MEQVPMRDGYGKALLELCRDFDNVMVLDADVAKSTRTEWIKAQFPQHFLDMGISEQDMSFPSELEAFRAYVRQYPNNLILLVDTYNTLKQGVPDAITVFNEMKEDGILPKKFGIRLDSGDLAYLSKEAKKMLDAAGYSDAIISASNDLDEYLIAQLKLQGCAINSWGVGTHLITAEDSPSMNSTMNDS